MKFFAGTFHMKRVWPASRDFRTCHPAGGPPQTELAMSPDGGQAEEVAQESFPDDLDQTPGLPPLRSGEPAEHPLGSRRIPRPSGCLRCAPKTTPPCLPQPRCSSSYRS